VQTSLNLWVWCSLTLCLPYLYVTRALSSHFLKVLKEWNSLALEESLESSAFLHNLGTCQGPVSRFKVKYVYMPLAHMADTYSPLCISFAAFDSMLDEKGSRRVHVQTCRLYSYYCSGNSM